MGQRAHIRSTLHESRATLSSPPHVATELPCALGTILLCLRFPLFLPFASFVSFCFAIYPLMVKLKLQLDAMWLWPHLGLAETGGEWILKAWWCWVSNKISLCLPTWASCLSKQKQRRTILPVHGRVVMVSVLQTMSSVTYSISLLRKRFTRPALCQVVWRKTNCSA